MTRPLRVLHVIPSLSPRRGGPTEAILPMVRALNERGVCVKIVTTNDDGVGVLNVPLDEWVQQEGVWLRYFPRFSPPVRALREYAYAKRFAAWLRENIGAYDIVHVHALFSYVSSVAMRWARHFGIPYVSRPLGLLGRWPLRQSRWRKRIYLAWGEAALVREADAVHFTSEMERREAEEFSPFPQGTVIPHGVAIPDLIPQAKIQLLAKLGLPSEQRLVLFLGRMHTKKGLDFLLAALGARHDPSTTLLLAGDGEVKFIERMKGLARENGIEDRVVWLGHVSGDEKQLLLQGADVFVLASRHENFGLGVLESLAAGTPVLVSDKVALADEVERYRLGKVVRLNAEAVSDALQEMLDRGADAKESSELRAWAAGRYSWDKNAAALSELYAGILASRSGK